MYASGATDATDPNTFQKHARDAKKVLPMTYNLIAMAMAASTATDPQATTAPSRTSATKCGGSHALVSIILVVIARFVVSS